MIEVTARAEGTITAITVGATRGQGVTGTEGTGKSIYFTVVVVVLCYFLMVYSHIFSLPRKGMILELKPISNQNSESLLRSRNNF